MFNLYKNKEVNCRAIQIQKHHEITSSPDSAQHYALIQGDLISVNSVLVPLTGDWLVEENLHKFVLYTDEDFQKKYNPVPCGLSFGAAIEAMKKGCKVAREGWNGRGMWCIYNPGSKGETHAMFEGSVYKNHGVDECEILPHFDMYTVNASGRRAMLPGWLASQSDMDANDWVIVE